MSASTNTAKEVAGPTRAPWSKTWFEEWAKSRPAELKGELAKTNDEAQKINIKFAIECYENGIFPPPLGNLVYIQGGKIVKTWEGGNEQGKLEPPTKDDSKPCWAEGSSICRSGPKTNAKDMQMEETHFEFADNSFTKLEEYKYTRAESMTSLDFTGKGHKVLLQVRLKKEQCESFVPDQKVMQMVIHKYFTYDTGSDCMNLLHDDVAHLGLGTMDPSGMIILNHRYHSLVGPHPSMTLNGPVWKYHMEVECRLLNALNTDKRTGAVVVDWWSEKCTITPDATYERRVTGPNLRKWAYIASTPNLQLQMVTPSKQTLISWLNSFGI